VKLSVVMAAHNAGRYLAEAVESVLSQTLTNFEFLIVDDASSDDTPRILANFRSQDSRVRLFRNDRQLGPFASANIAIRAARGTFVARHDADDVSHPARLATQLRAIESEPDIALVSGPVEVVDAAGPGHTSIHHPQMWQPRLEWELLFANAGGTAANVMFPRLFRGVPIVYPAAQRYAEDYGLWCTLTRLGRVLCVSDVLYRYRRHSLSITGSRLREQHPCAAEIRRAYQAHYLRPGLPTAAVAEVVRFWNCAGDRRLAVSVPLILSVLGDLRSDFLAYAERRYGRADRSALDAQLDEALRARLGYWLFRSVRFLDARSSRELASIAGTGTPASGVSFALAALSQRVRAAVKTPQEESNLDRSTPMRYHSRTSPMGPLVSILIPAFNAERFVRAALTSAIDQTWPSKEIILVDDGSADGTLAIARRFASSGVKVVTQEHRGAAAARNTAYSLSQGDYIQWLDADDLLSPDKIEQQMQMAERIADPRALLSCAWAHFLYRQSAASFVASPLWQDLTPLEWLVRKMEHNAFMQTATWLVSRELTEAAGSWDVRLLGDDDGEYFCRVLMRSSGTRFVPDARVFYRRTGTGLSRIGWSRERLEADVLSKQLHIDYVLSMADGERVRAACLTYLQQNTSILFLRRPDLTAQAQRLATRLGGNFEIPRLSWKYSWVQPLFGTTVAAAASLTLPLVKLSLTRLWDRALFNLQPWAT
jgi:glycosyltransferase involved in cell wall biosynthesis